MGHTGARLAKISTRLTSLSLPEHRRHGLNGNPRRRAMRLSTFGNLRSRLHPWVVLCLAAQAATAFGLSFNVTLAGLTNHNTSAYSAYNQANFAANFGTTTWVSQSGATMPVDPTKMDMSLNPITPGHVSKTDVHTLIPNRPDLRWFAHATPWFGSSSHISNGENDNTSAYVAAMVTDMKARGFNGVVIDWYGQGSSEDQATLKLQTYLATLTNNTFRYIIMVDKGAVGSSTNALQSAVQYCQSQYFADPNYEREPVSTGKPILMFFGVRSAVGQAGMAAVKAATGGQMVWVEQGTGYLSESWEDECFEWTHEYDNGVNYSDPFNLAAVTAPYSTIAQSGKKAFGGMCGNFNGTLTKLVSWSEGKYLPSSNGVCVVQRAASISSFIPANMTRMQWCTWSDWEEGTQVESGIENNIALTAQLNTSNVLSWTLTSGYEQTVDHYEIYASTNGVNAALLCSVRTGVYQTNLSRIGLVGGTYQFYVDAIGKPCIRDHMSQPVLATLSTGPVITQQPTNVVVGYGGTATFWVSASGPQPFTYNWYDLSLNIIGTNNPLVITNATQNDSYLVYVINQYGSSMSTWATLTVTTGLVVTTDLQPLSQTVWQADPVSFSFAASGMAPLSYQWMLNGQGIPGATDSTYSFEALAGTNYYAVTVTNSSSTVTSSTAAVFGVAAPFPDPAGYNTMRITFSGYTNAAGVTNFPVLVRLSTSIPGFSYGQFASPGNGADLRFTAANGREVPFQIDEWNPAGESQVWVQVPSISSTNDYITAYWGNAGDSSAQAWSTNGLVWTGLTGSNGFQLVYHLSQSGFPYADSTLQYPATSGVAPGSGAGIVGHGAAFNGSSQYLNAGLVNVGKTFTLSAWVNIAPAATSEQTIWCNKMGGWAVAGFDFYVNSYQTNDGIIYLDTADGVGGNVSPRTVPHAVSFGQWHQLTGTLDGVNGSVRVYVDGVDQTINEGVDTAFQATNTVRCGALLSGNLYLNGSMDEARIESGVRSPAWVWASWATVANSAFASYGSIVPPTVTLQIQIFAGQPVLTWPAGTLQAATNVTGSYADVAGATSPYTPGPSGDPQFFRVRVR